MSIILHPKIPEDSNWIEFQVMIYNENWKRWFYVGKIYYDIIKAKTFEAKQQERGYTTIIMKKEIKSEVVKN